jgi:cytochrome c-type biogenesis protein CcmF
MSTPGALGLFIACILLAFSSGFSLLAETNRPRLLTWARLSFHGAGAIALWCLMLLFAAFLLNDFSIRYVVNHSSIATPWYYRLSALWAGPEGTLFLWLFLILAGTSIVAFQIRGGEFHLHRRVILIGSLISLPLLAMILFFANPFTPKLVPVGDGQGLNPLLRDWAMIIHPPILFAGYACLAVAFVLATSRSDDSVAAQLLARWTRLACGTLTAGIVTGALWAYDELGWGGYWGWDPVENASLVPWLISFALLHFTSRQAMVLTRSAVMLAGLAFAGTIVATYLTRSGIVFSLHAFSDNSSAGIFLIALVIVLLFTIIRVFRMPRSANPLPGTMTLTMWWLIMMTLAVLIGTLWPVWARAMIENPQPLPATFYNTTVGLMGLGLLITLGVCSFRSIRRPRQIEVLLISATLASVTCFVLWFFLGRFEIMKLISLFVLVADVVIIFFDVLGRRKQFLYRLPMTLAHLGLIILSLGLLASMAQPTVKSLVLEKQQTDKSGQLRIRLDNLKADEKKDGTVTVQADIEVTMPYRREILHPSQTLLPDGRHRIEPDFRAGLFSDIYAVLEGFSGTQALVSVRRNWLVGWVWGGSSMILIACLLATTKRRRSK